MKIGYFFLSFMLFISLIYCSSENINQEINTSNKVINMSNINETILLYELEGHTGAVYSLLWSPDGNYLASTSQDSTIRIWDRNNFKSNVLEGHTNSVWGLSWSPDSKKIVSVALDKTARIWDIETGKEILSIKTGTTRNYSVAWSHNGKYIAIGQSNGWINLIDANSGKKINEWEAHTEGGLSTEIITIKWSLDDTLIASGGLDYSIRVWDTTNYNQIVQLKADTTKRNDINGLNWSNNNKYIASAGQDGNIRIWDWDANLNIKTFNHSSQWVRGIVWSLDDTMIISTGNNAVIKIWLVETEELLLELEEHESPIWSIDWSPDGKLIASGSGLYDKEGGDTKIRIWGIRE